jgi:hypothetical protein
VMVEMFSSSLKSLSVAKIVKCPAGARGQARFQAALVQ